MSHQSKDSRERALPWRDLIGLTVDRVSTTVEGMHGAIAKPWFRMAGPLEKQVRTAYTSATSAIYGSVRVIARGVGVASDLVLAASDAEPTHRSDAVQAFANAVWGDEFQRRGSAMALELALRDRSGKAIPLDSQSIAQAFPLPSDRIVVLLHGLGQTERCFASSDSSPGLIEALDSSPHTPVLIRYNSGRSVAENGVDLAMLLDELTARWPVAVSGVSLVGYSMGGLVARAALDSGRSESRRWVESVRHVVTVATPHGGSPIEKAADLAARSLMLTPQSRPLGAFIAGRSAGIRDLHSGVDLPATFDGIQHHTIAAVVTSNAESPVGGWLGDLVVRPASSTGGGEVLADNRALIGGRRHFDILHEESVPDRILGWIGDD